MRRPVIAIVSAALLCSAAAASPAEAVIKKHVKFANCAAMNKEFPHGVAKAKGLRDKDKKGRILAHGVKTYVVIPAIYNQNKALDTDKDGIVCEKA
jgi:Excalibur calcium-binding domain